MDFVDLVKKTDSTQDEVLPETTCKCFNKGKAAILKCKICNGTGLVPNPDYPLDGKCKAGHFSTNKRFWKISGRVVERRLWGVYCNDCVLVLREMVRRKKNGRR